MTPLMALFSYGVIWHITLFMLLPVKQWPWRKKLLMNSALAAAVTFALHLLLLSGWVPLRDVYPAL